MTTHEHEQVTPPVSGGVTTEPAVGKARLKSRGNEEHEVKEDKCNVDQKQLENEENQLADKTSEFQSKLNFYSSTSEFEKEPETVHKRVCFRLAMVGLDYSISMFVIAPLVIGCWGSLWWIMESNADILPDANSFLFSSTLIFVLTLIREDLTLTVVKMDNKCFNLCYLLLSRAYIYIFFICGILQWTSLSSLLDFYFENDVTVLLSLTLSSALFVVYFKMSASLLAPPYIVGKDWNPNDVFVFPTWFGVSPKESSMFLYLMDCFFSVFVIGSLLVFVWRGAWMLIDIYLFPNDPNASAYCSVVIGYIVVFITFALQPTVKMLVTKLRGFRRLCVVDGYLIFSFMGTINVWRGIWNLLNLYFLPNLPTVSAWLCHLGCFFILVLINSSNSLLVRGVYTYEEEEGATSVDFPCYYLRLFFLAKKEEKLLRLFQKRQTSEVDIYVSSLEAAATPQKTKLQEPAVIV